MSKSKSISFAILAALLYGISSPVSKLLLKEIPPTFMAALLYLGAGIGMLIINIFIKVNQKKETEAKMTVKELPYILGMIVLDIAAPIFLMIGLTMSAAENVALLNNFEIVATSIIALTLFKEAIGKRMWIAILLITLASIILSVRDFSSLSFSLGSVFVIAACISWGFENNCTRMLSLKDPLQIVVVKGFGSGSGALIITMIIGEYSNNLLYVICALILGFVAYGLSIYFYISAQRELGAARTSAFYAAAPFIGVIASWIAFSEPLTLSFFAGLIIMLAGTYFALNENHIHKHVHHEMTHEHKHSHDDKHHTHTHESIILGEHSHVHTHKKMVHRHIHTPDIHHRHEHNKD